MMTYLKNALCVLVCLRIWILLGGENLDGGGSPSGGVCGYNSSLPFVAMISWWLPYVDWNILVGVANLDT